jgi:hypothetical protein
MIRKYKVIYRTIYVIITFITFLAILKLKLKYGQKIGRNERVDCRIHEEEGLLRYSWDIKKCHLNRYQKKL